MYKGIIILCRGTKEEALESANDKIREFTFDEDEAVVGYTPFDSFELLTEEPLPIDSKDAKEAIEGALAFQRQAFKMKIEELRKVFDKFKDDDLFWEEIDFKTLMWFSELTPMASAFKMLYDTFGLAIFNKKRLDEVMKELKPKWVVIYDVHC